MPFAIPASIVLLTLCHVSSASTLLNLCSIPMDGSCQCTEETEDPNTQLLAHEKRGVRVECHNMTGIGLHHDIELIVKFLNASRSVSSLKVRDSNLAHMSGLPSGLLNLKQLVLENTNIDLEQIRESSESLPSLKTIKIFRETFTEIPEDFFKDFHGLNNLGLNNVGFKAISNDGLEFLEDSLKELSLRGNKLRQIPRAVQYLQNLESLDLIDNEITLIPDETGDFLESGLRSLSTLRLNTVNCTCPFGRGPFAEWIRSHAISGVTCKYPAPLYGRDVSATPDADYCIHEIGNTADRLTLCIWLLLSSQIVACGSLFLLVLR